jgi:Mu-like prophage protein gp36
MPVVTVYCTEADMQRLFSAAGVQSFGDHEQTGAPVDDVTDDCIDQATEEINLFCRQYYLAADLANSTLINRWCTVLSVYFLCQRRGNPVPESIQAEFERIMLYLERVRTGEMKLPDVPYAANLSPSFSNMTVDRRFPASRVRVEQRSSDGIPSALTQKFAGEVPIE